MNELVKELAAKYSPQLCIHQRMFSLPYNGGQLQELRDLLTDLANDKKNQLRHSFPALYHEVFFLAVRMLQWS